MARTGSSAEEAEAVLDAIEADVARRGAKIGPLRRYVAGFDDRDLQRVLRQVRAQRSPEARAGASAPVRRTVCSLHAMQGACSACRDELREGGPMAQAVIDMYTALGADAATLRPDLAANPAIRELAATG